MAPPIGPTLKWTKPWCFALALAAEHQMPPNSSTTNWSAVTLVLNEVLSSDPTFNRDFPTGSSRTCYQTQWSERDRGKSPKWRFDVTECSASELVDMHAIRDVVLATELRLSLQLNTEVQTPKDSSNRWPVYRLEDRAARLAAETGATRQTVTAEPTSLSATKRSDRVSRQVLQPPTTTRAKAGYETQTKHFTSIIEEIRTLNSGDLAMVHARDVDFRSGRPVCNLSTSNRIELVSARSELRFWGGEVRRVLFADTITGQSNEMDVMLCDRGECSICHPEDNSGRRSDPKNTFQALPLVHRKDAVWLEDGVVVFQPIDQVPVGASPCVLNGEVCNVVFNGEFDAVVNEERTTTKAIICDYFDHEDPDDAKCPSCLAYAGTTGFESDRVQAPLAGNGVAQGGFAGEDFAGVPAEKGFAEDDYAVEGFAEGSSIEEGPTEEGFAEEAAPTI